MHLGKGRVRKGLCLSVWPHLHAGLLLFAVAQQVGQDRHVVGDVGAEGDRDGLALAMAA